MTMIEHPAENATTPGREIRMTDVDYRRLLSQLETVEMMLHNAFTNEITVPLIAKPLHTAAVVQNLRETIERNAVRADVPITVDAETTLTYTGGAVYPQQTYRVRREIGQLDQSKLAPKWVWTSHSEVEMTGAEFFACTIPGERYDYPMITRSRFHLLDADGKILRERFGYK